MIVGSGYRVWFVTSNRKVSLPVNPNEITVQYEGDSTTYNVIGIGDVVIPRTPKLTQISFESFFPRLGEYTYTNETDYPEPAEYVDFFRTLQNDKTVFKLVITRTDNNEITFDTNFYAVMNNFQITDKGGEPGDVYYSLSVSEWRDAQPESLEVKKEGVEKAGETVEPKELVVVKQRKNDEKVLKPGQTVTVSGKVYNEETETDEFWRKTKRTLIKSDCVISRVLPPTLGVERVFLLGIGWVDKSSCITSNVFNTGNHINDMKKYET